MYYKIISGGLIVDASEDLNYVRWQEKNRIFLTCGAENADGIVTSDGQAIYLLPETDQIGEYAYASTAEITYEEYVEIREELDAGAEIPDEEEEIPDTPAKTRLQMLEEQVAELTSMTAKDNIAKGSYFVLHDNVYRATSPIVKGTEIKPGRNCEKKALDDITEQKGD